VRRGTKDGQRLKKGKFCVGDGKKLLNNYRGYQEGENSKW